MEIDQDCNGGDVCYIDADADGYRGSDNATQLSVDLDCDDFGEADASVDASDCDDNNMMINVDADEIVADGIDQDCDGTELCYVDADSDGYREVTGMETVESLDMDCTDLGEGSEDEPSTDCDDSVASSNPGATELVGDGADQDCDGTELCYVDQDGDGYRTLETVQSLDSDCDDPTEANVDMPAGDCNDNAPGINPGVEEIPGDGVDQDCSGADIMVDEPSAEPTEEPSEEPTEPSEEDTDVTEEDIPADKEGCSTVSTGSFAWFLALPALLFTRRRR